MSGPLDEQMWGPAPMPEQARAIERRLRATADARRRWVVANSIPDSAAASRLGLTVVALADRIARGDLIALTDAGVVYLPLWQFDASLEEGYVPGITEIRRYFPAGPTSLTSWVLRPSADLDGRTPRDVLAAGEVQRVVDVASTLTGAGW